MALALDGCRVAGRAGWLADRAGWLTAWLSLTGWLPMSGAGPGWQRSLSSLGSLAGCRFAIIQLHQLRSPELHVNSKQLTVRSCISWQFACGVAPGGQNKDPPGTEHRTYQGQRRWLYMRLCLINFLGPSSIQSYHCLCSWHIDHSSSPRAPAEAVESAQSGTV